MGIFHKYKTAFVLSETFSYRVSLLDFLFILFYGGHASSHTIPLRAFSLENSLDSHQRVQEKGKGNSIPFLSSLSVSILLL